MSRNRIAETDDDVPPEEPFPGAAKLLPSLQERSDHWLADRLASTAGAAGAGAARWATTPTDYGPLRREATASLIQSSENLQQAVFSHVLKPAVHEIEALGWSMELGRKSLDNANRSAWTNRNYPPAFKVPADLSILEYKSMSASGFPGPSAYFSFRGADKPSNIPLPPNLPGESSVLRPREHFYLGSMAELREQGVLNPSESRVFGNLSNSISGLQELERQSTALRWGNKSWTSDVWRESTDRVHSYLRPQPSVDIKTNGGSFQAWTPEDLVAHDMIAEELHGQRQLLGQEVRDLSVRESTHALNRSNMLKDIGAIAGGQVANYAVDKLAFGQVPTSLKTTAIDGALPFIAMTSAGWRGKLGVMVGGHVAAKIWDQIDAGK